MADYFDADVRRAGWHRLHKGDVFSPPLRQRVVVVGTVLWDYGALNTLADLAVRAKPSSIPIYVFDLDDVRSLEDLVKYMPGVDLPLATPFAAEYADGDVSRKAEGADVLNLIAPSVA